MYFIGIDTSCYTSSVAIVDHNENVLYDGRILLEVGSGGRGLRQSDAVFQHMSNLPKLCAEAFEKFNASKIVSIGVSTRPRNVEGSYMPVFTAGHNIAKIIAGCTNAPIIECSHQQGHIIAGAWSINKHYDEKHFVYHISGGTTELLLADPEACSAEIIGGTEDLNAGQFIDRVGVSLGLKFPCGKEMDKLCNEISSEAVPLPLAVKSTMLSFSGPESHVQRLINQEKLVDGQFKSKIARAVFLSIAEALEKTIINAYMQYKTEEVLLVGGVASNSIISSRLQNSTKAKKIGIEIKISKPQYSSDNAVGAAINAKRAYINFGGLHEQC